MQMWRSSGAIPAWLFCTAVDFGDVPEWIPDTRRFASLAGEAGNDDIN
jgi:hypothetical protein